ncbi:unnamed protein product [Ectocarpus sp. 12 AP-2014]
MELPGGPRTTMPAEIGFYDVPPVSDLVAKDRAKRAEENMATFTADKASWEGKSVVSVSQFSTEGLGLLYDVAGKMKEMVADKSEDATLSRNPPLRGRVLGTLFYETSTRTACSFQAAVARLGGTFVSVDPASSSIKKGESLEDTVMSLLSYCDGVALRHPAKGAARAAVGVARRPVLNAGDGVGEHPTQALLDLYTIAAELGGEAGLSGLRGKVVALIGDLKHGRTVHSLAKLLARFGCVLRYVSPASLQMPRYIQDEVESVGESVQTEVEDIGVVLEEADVLYVTRVQKERFASREEFDRVNGSYKITPEVLSKVKPSSVLMHPLPRVGEIVEDCDLDPRAAYFKQMENGMYVRMALLALVFGKA